MKIFKKIKEKKAKKPTLKELFSSRASKAGGFSLAAMAIVLAIIIAVNMIAGVLPEKYTEFDLSANGDFTIGDTTLDVLSKTDKDITIYYICTSGNEDTYVNTLLNSYDAVKNVTVKTIDPVVNPTFTSKYTEDEVSDNSVIVVCEDNSKVVSSDNMYEYEMDYSSYSYNTTAFSAENAITNAIDFVTSGIVPTVSFLTGHGEKELDSTFSSALSDANFKTDTLSLIASGEISEETDCIGILAPQSDYSDDEIKILKEYINNGGKMFIATDELDAEKCPKFTAFLKEYGIELVDGIVMELNTNRCYRSYFYLLPEIQSHDITSGFDGYYIMFPIAQGFHISDETAENISASSLLKTSDEAYSAINAQEKESTEMEDGDIASDGGFDLGAAVTVTNDTDTEGKLVYYSASTFIDSQVNSYVSGANSSLFVKSFSWLCGKTSSVSIPSKSLEREALTLSTSNVSAFEMLFLVVLPAGTLICGIVIWLRRKKH